ncbi:MAG: S8 family peptidase [Phycisphaerales bacterium]
MNCTKMIAALGLAAGFAHPAVGAFGRGGGGDDTRAPREFVVNLAAGVDVQAVAGPLAAEVLFESASRRLFLLRVPEGADEDAVTLLLENDPRVLNLDYHRRLLPSEPVTQSFFLRETRAPFEAQEGTLPIDLPGARPIGRGAGVTVAVIDTGLWPHEQFIGAAVPGFDYVTGLPGALDAGSGPRVGHGTFVAGLIHFVAPEAIILPMRVVSDMDARASSLAIALAILDSVDAGADVINISLVAERRDNIVRDAILTAEAAGVVVVAAMGNGGAVAPREYPADEPRAIAVAAVNNAGMLAGFSNVGGNTALCAPGVNLIGPVSGATTPGDPNPYMHGDGTSLSAALVSGACAVVRSIQPSADPAKVRAILAASAMNIAPMNPGQAALIGAGMLDVGAAARSARCLVDFDGNGLLSPDDLDDFITAYFEPVDGGSSLDINDDGVVSPDDIDDFITMFFDASNGCVR